MTIEPKQTFEAGATVALRSGGPALTVLGQVGDRVHCIYFSEEIGEFRESMLPEVALILVDLEDDFDTDEDAPDDEPADDESADSAA